MTSVKRIAAYIGNTLRHLNPPKPPAPFKGACLNTPHAERQNNLFQGNAAFERPLSDRMDIFRDCRRIFPAGIRFQNTIFHMKIICHIQ